MTSVHLTSLFTAKMLFFYNTCFSLHVFDVSAVEQLMFWHPRGTHPTQTTQSSHPTLLIKYFPSKHAFSSCPSAPLCQTCAALLKCWIINVHKHFKRWRTIAPKLARWSCIWWGYCFRQWGKVQTVFWTSNLLMERNQIIKPAQSVFTPRTNTSGGHLRTLVIADLCEYLLQEALL